MTKLTNEIERKLESVRKERSEIISIIEETINKTYNNINNGINGN